MKTLFTAGFAMLLIAAGFALTNNAMAETKSLRGDHAVDEPSAKPEITRWQEDKEPIPRDYIQQPPLIPHSIDC